MRDNDFFSELDDMDELDELVILHPKARLGKSRRSGRKARDFADLVFRDHTIRRHTGI